MVRTQAFGRSGRPSPRRSVRGGTPSRKRQETTSHPPSHARHNPLPRAPSLWSWRPQNTDGRLESGAPVVVVVVVVVWWQAVGTSTAVVLGLRGTPPRRLSSRKRSLWLWGKGLTPFPFLSRTTGHCRSTKSALPHPHPPSPAPAPELQSHQSETQTHEGSHFGGYK